MHKTTYNRFKITLMWFVQKHVLFKHTLNSIFCINFNFLHLKNNHFELKFISIQFSILKNSELWAHLALNIFIFFSLWHWKLKLCAYFAQINIHEYYTWESMFMFSNMNHWVTCTSILWVEILWIVSWWFICVLAYVALIAQNSWLVSLKSLIPSGYFWDSSRHTTFYIQKVGKLRHIQLVVLFALFCQQKEFCIFSLWNSMHFT